MTDVSEGQWRWPLPDNWEPTGFWCVQITIPGDQQYFDRLTGALGLLTLSKSWFPDPTREGPKTVAHTWESALYLNIFSVNTDCIVTPSPPIPDQAAADDAAAAYITVFFQHIVATMNACATNYGACAGCVDDIMNELEPYGAAGAVRGALNDLCTDLNASPDTRAEYETDCVYGNEYDAMRQHIHDNPYDWLNSISDFMFNWLNETADRILKDLNIVGGLIGGGGIQKYVDDNGGIPSGGGAGFGTGCTFHHVFWASGNDGGWVNLGQMSFAGTYWTTPESAGTKLVDLGRYFESRTLTHIELHGYVSDVANGGTRLLVFGSQSLALSDGAGDISFTWDGAETATSILMALDINSPPGVAVGRFLSIVVDGIGQDPFV